MLRLNAACQGVSIELQCVSHCSWRMLTFPAARISAFGRAMTEKRSELADGKR